MTIQQYPHGFIKSLCGIVCARSVKLLSSSKNEEDLESRDKWWNEIRNEIRSQLLSLNCDVVLGYSESKSICEDVCVLSASGTAAIVDDSYFAISHTYEPHSPEHHHHHNLHSAVHTNHHLNSFFDHGSFYLNKQQQPLQKSCKLCHIPYPETDLPFPVALSPCSTCGQGLVPDVIFSSIQPVSEIECIGKGCLLKAIVTRPLKKAASSESTAKLISDYLPFMEYELHRQLLGKLKLKAMNMLYGLRVQISIGENLIIGMIEATACYAAALPQPQAPKIIYENKTASKTKQEIDEIERMRKMINIEMNKNKEFFSLNQHTTL